MQWSCIQVISINLSFSGDAVKVDESLFQDLDDLDISDEDDEDYVPGKRGSESD